MRILLLAFTCVVGLIACETNGSTGNRSGSSLDPVAACSRFVAAYTDCYEESGTTIPPELEEECSVYEDATGPSALELADLFGCYARSVEQGDCSDELAAFDTVTMLDSCL